MNDLLVRYSMKFVHNPIEILRELLQEREIILYGYLNKLLREERLALINAMINEIELHKVSYIT